MLDLKANKNLDISPPKITLTMEPQSGLAEKRNLCYRFIIECWLHRNIKNFEFSSPNLLKSLLKIPNCNLFSTAGLKIKGI